jgi:hypothetical protein
MGIPTDIVPEVEFETRARIAPLRKARPVDTSAAPILRELKAALDLAPWSSEEARKCGIRRLATAMSNTMGLDEKAFGLRLSTLVYERCVPLAWAMIEESRVVSGALVSESFICTSVLEAASATRTENLNALVEASVAAASELAEALRAEALNPAPADEWLRGFCDCIAELLPHQRVNG